MNQATLPGRILPVPLTLRLFSCDQHPIRKNTACSADADTTTRRSDWGLTNYVPNIGDEVAIKIRVEALRLS